MREISNTDLQTLRQEALAAERRIRPHIRLTPLESSRLLSSRGDASVYLKLENLQLTGSFKLRGALNKLLSLNQRERERGIVTASSGNHGHAVAFLAERFGIPGAIFLPETTDPSKIETLRSYGVELRIQGDDCVKAEAAARAAAADQDRTYISPYNDPQIIAGQATVGIEIGRQLDGFDTVLVPVGGGGLISGIAACFKTEKTSIEVIGCQPENSRVMTESVKAGQILEMESLPTLSDGTAGGIEAGSITFDICRRHVDDFILLSEHDIRSAVTLILERHHLLVEGAGALPVGAFMKYRSRFARKRVVLILSGSQLSLATLKKILEA